MVRYAGVLAAIVAAMLLRAALDPWLGPGTPFITYYPAVALCAWYGGVGPGLLATALSAVITSQSLALATGDVLALSVFGTMGVMFAIVGGFRGRAIGRLAQQERELRAALALRDEFLSIAAHELKTPLAALLLQVQSAQRKETEPAQKKKLDGAVRQAGRLAGLIESLLSVARITTGRLELNVEQHDLAGIVREAAERARIGAERAGSRLIVDVPATLLGSWDRLRVEQVLANLIDNAIKYGRGAPITVTATGDAEQVTIRVVDHGIGIEAGKLATIFDRFERGVSSSHYGGLGLGLYIARQIVAAHGGTIAARSTPGEGAAFTVTLPRETVTRSGEAGPPPRRSGP